MNYTEKYIEKGILEPSLHWFKENEVLQTIIGSKAYGTNNDDSDIDVVSIVMPKFDNIDIEIEWVATIINNIRKSCKKVEK